MEKSILEMVGGEKYINPHFDIKVAKEYTTLQERIDKLEKENVELKAQIKKMKCCQNCTNWNWKHSKCEKKLKGDCFKASKWELRR